MPLTQRSASRSIPTNTVRSVRSSSQLQLASLDVGSVTRRLLPTCLGTGPVADLDALNILPQLNDRKTCGHRGRNTTGEDDWTYPLGLTVEARRIDAGS
jgi:hypothetical protein